MWGRDLINKFRNRPTSTIIIPTINLPIEPYITPKPPFVEARRLSKLRSIPTSTAIIPTGDIPLTRVKNQKVTGIEIRELCELIRKRYALDVKIWSLKEAGAEDHKDIWKLIQKSVAALAKIRRILESWDREDLFDSGADWEKVRVIRSRVEGEGKRNWVRDPPWVGY